MDSLANRYANALLSLASEKGAIAEYRQNVKELRKAFLENEEIIKILNSAFIEFNEKEQIIDKIVIYDDYIKNFIKVIVRNSRSNQIIKIFNEFIKICNERLQIKDGIVYSTRLLSEEEIQKIESGIEKRLQSKVELENVIDKKLIGGVKVIVEDKIFDGSIKNKVEKLKESLVKGGA